MAQRIPPVSARRARCRGIAFFEKRPVSSGQLSPRLCPQCLALFDDALLADWVPTTIQANGPTPELAYLLSWLRTLFQARGGDIAHAVLPYMKSTSPLLTAGALQTLYFMKPQYDWRSHPDLPALMDRTVAGEAERLIETHNATILQPVALYLGIWKNAPRAHCCATWLSASTGHNPPAPVSFQAKRPIHPAHHDSKATARIGNTVWLRCESVQNTVRYSEPGSSARRESARSNLVLFTYPSLP